MTSGPRLGADARCGWTERTPVPDYTPAPAFPTTAQGYRLDPRRMVGCLPGCARSHAGSEPHRRPVSFAAPPDRAAARGARAGVRRRPARSARSGWTRATRSGSRDRRARTAFLAAHRGRRARPRHVGVPASLGARVRPAISETRTVNPLQGISPRRLHVRDALPSPGSSDPDHAVAFGELVVRLADAVEAAYGFAGALCGWPPSSGVELPAGRRGAGPPAVQPADGIHRPLRAARRVLAQRLRPGVRRAVRRRGSTVSASARTASRNGGLVVWAAELPDLVRLRRVAVAPRLPMEAAVLRGPGARAHSSTRSVGSGGSRPDEPDDHRRLAGRDRLGHRPLQAHPARPRRPTTPGLRRPRGPREPDARVARRDRSGTSGPSGSSPTPTRDDARMAADLAADHAAEWG